jgi:hypothetical protein
MNPFSFHVSGSSMPVATPHPDVNSAAAASLQAPASARKQALLGLIDEEIKNIRGHAENSSDGSSGYRVRRLEEATELMGVRDAIAALADEASFITLPPGLRETVTRAVEVAARVAGLEVRYDGPGGPSPGGGHNLSISAVVQPAMQPRKHASQSSAPVLIEGMLPDLWTVIGGYANNSRVSNLELAGRVELAELAELTEGLIRSEPDEAVKDVYRAQARLAQLKLQQRESGLSEPTSFSEPIKAAAGALRRALDAVSAWCPDFDLHTALERGHAPVVTAHFSSLQGPGLPHLRVLAIVTAKDSAGMPGLYVAMLGGNASSVSAYMKGLEGLVKGPMGPDFSPLRIAAIVMARDPQGNTALHVALHHGRAAAVTAFMEGLKGLGLSLQQIREIVAPKDRNGSDDLWRALPLNQPATLAAFKQGLSHLGFDQQQIADIVAVSALDKALDWAFDRLGLVTRRREPQP